MFKMKKSMSKNNLGSVEENEMPTESESSSSSDDSDDFDVNTDEDDNVLVNKVIFSFVNDCCYYGDFEFFSGPSYEQNKFPDTSRTCHSMIILYESPSRFESYGILSDFIQ